MPLYEYRCLECGRHTEVLQKFSDAPLRRCEECRGKLEKLVSRSAFHLKGGGWYAGGYGASDSKKVDSKEPQDKKDKKDGGKTETSAGGSDSKKDSGKTEAPAAGSGPKKAARK